MPTESPTMEFPQAFERRLGMQLVEEGHEKQREFFKTVAGGVLECDQGQADERVAAADFLEKFGKAYLEACQLYMANLPLSAIVSMLQLPVQMGLKPGADKVLALMLFCEVAAPMGAVIGANGNLTAAAEPYLALTSFMMHTSKFSTARPTETVDECLHRFIAVEKERFEAMQLDEGPEFVKWTPRYIYDMALSRTIEAMEPDFVLMKTDETQARFVVHQDIPGSEYYQVTFIDLNLDVLLTQGTQSFENQIYRHPRYRTQPPNTPKEAIVEDKTERDIATVIKDVLNEVPDDVKGDVPASGYIEELNDILRTPLDAINARWDHFIEIINTWMPPKEILEHTWMLKAVSKLFDQPEEKVREATLRYLAAGGRADD